MANLAFRAVPVPLPYGKGRGGLQGTEIVWSTVAEWPSRACVFGDPRHPASSPPQVPVGHQQLGLLLLFASIGQLSGWWRSNPVLTGISSGSGTLHGSERLVVLLIFWAT